MDFNQKPNVFLAGAPKCGTTSLACWLSEHPKCFVTPKKEPHFFGDLLHKDASLEEYENLFRNALPNHQIRIDASSSYFTNQDAIDDILAYVPEARFIIMLRDPVDIAYAWHSECLYLGRENKTFFEKAWRLQEMRKKNRRVPLSCNNPEMLFYRDQGLLGRSLAYLLAHVENSKVHWIFMEDLNTNPKQCYRDVLRFLELEDDGRTEFSALNRSKRHRYPVLNRGLRTLGCWRSTLGLRGLGIRAALNRYAKVEEKREPLSNEFRRELYEAFRDDIRLLARLTGRDLSHWAPNESE